MAAGEEVWLGYEEPEVHVRLGELLGDRLLRARAEGREVLFLCIGSSKVTGDAFGPLVGSRLWQVGLPPGFLVLGTMDFPIDAANLPEAVEVVRGEGFYVVAVDAGLGARVAEGSLLLAEGPLLPGAGVGRRLPPVGDVRLVGFVSRKGWLSPLHLATAPLDRVMAMAGAASSAILHAIRLATGPTLTTHGVMSYNRGSDTAEVCGR